MPSTDRGYGSAHRRERKRWQSRVDRGEVLCARCDEPIEFGDQWDLDHTDDRTGYLGPSHSGCNRSAGAIKGNRREVPEPVEYVPSIDW